MWNARLDEPQAEIKIARKISITSDTQVTLPFMAETKEKLNSLLINVEEESGEKKNTTT